MISNHIQEEQMGINKNGKPAVVACTIIALFLVSLQTSRSFVSSGVGHRILDEMSSKQYISGIGNLSEESSTVGSKVRKRAFICITGQLSRLELDNKEENLFRHWHDNFEVDMDVALVLSETNYSSVRRGGTIDQAYFSTVDVADRLNKLPGVTVLNTEDFVPAENPVVNPVYYRQRSADNSQSEEQKFHRAQNHIRQFESMAQCYYHMVQSPRAGKEYDIVHRLRDDSGYYLPVPFDKVYRMTQKEPKTMVSSSCQQHLGINDRGSFVSPVAAYDYFVHPIIFMYTQSIPEDVRSTEMFLMHTYSKTAHLVETHHFRMFRIFTSTVKGTDVLRLIPGTNFDSEGGTVERCLENLETDEPRRSVPRCYEFADGRTVCVETA